MADTDVSMGWLDSRLCWCGGMTAAFYMNRKNLYVAAKGFNIIFVDHMVTVFNIVCLCESAA